jgi:hypothetical protein
MDSMIKFKRTITGPPDDYGTTFTKELNRTVGGKRQWKYDEWPHGMTVTEDNGLRVKRCEDGPEFYLNLANTFAAYGSMLLALISLWRTIPKREKQFGGKRYIEINHPGISVRINITDPHLAERRLEKLLKVLR